MYIPPYFKEDDEQQLLSFIKANSFAVLVSKGDELKGTHLPFVVGNENGNIVLTSHMAKNNEQWRDFDKRDILVIFNGPHGYVSPSLYEKKENVPTWNYIAVHAYGKPEIISKNHEVIAVMESMIRQYDENYFKQWKELKPEYVDGMLKGIVAFKIVVNKLQGKFKLSQNKKTAEQQNIISAFEKSEDSQARDIAKAMNLRKKH